MDSLDERKTWGVVGYLGLGSMQAVRYVRS